MSNAFVDTKMLILFWSDENMELSEGQGYNCGSETKPYSDNPDCVVWEPARI